MLKIISIFYLGTGVKCPICNASFREFLPYGRVGRSNALCPKCLSLERHRLIWLYLQRKTDFFTAKLKMLHIAPEHCFISRFEALPTLEYITGDLESPLAKVKMDIQDIPFDENTFDVIFCNHVLEHVDDDIKSMSEINRVLKSGGWAILQIPFFYPLSDVTIEDLSITDPKKREELFGQDDHVRKYGKDFPNRIQSVGLHVKEEKLIFELDEKEREYYALPKEEIIYRAEKV